MAPSARSAQRDDNGDSGKHRGRASGKGVCEGRGGDREVPFEKGGVHREHDADGKLLGEPGASGAVYFRIEHATDPLARRTSGDSRPNAAGGPGEGGLLFDGDWASSGSGGAVYEYYSERERERRTDSGDCARTADAAERPARSAARPRGGAI